MQFLGANIQYTIEHSMIDVSPTVQS